MADEGKKVDALTFEAAYAELESIVEKLEKGTVPLAESITIYARGEALKARCDALLKDAEMRVEKIAIGADGKAQATEKLNDD